MYGAGFLYCWFIAEMVGETRPYKSVLFDFWVGRAGFLYCGFIAEMVGETRPYQSIDIILEDDRLYIRCAIPFDRQRTRFINFD